MHSTRIASINIKGISTPTRVGNVQDFIRRHDLDLVFLQEVTHPAILTVTAYTTYFNIGANMRGTAILERQEFPLTNVYAPADTAKRSEREHFFNSELPSLFYAATHSVLLGGYFNFVLHPTDTTVPFTTSRVLTEVIRGLALSAAWNQDPQRPAYTHLSPTGATRIDRFYMTQDQLMRKIGTEILPAAFTDHNAVVLSLSLHTDRTVWRRGSWKMDPVLITDEAVKEKIRSAWAKWRRNKHYYSDESMWWER
jgi:hypothetical protein